MTIDSYLLDKDKIIYWLALTGDKSRLPRENEIIYIMTTSGVIKKSIFKDGIFFIDEDIINIECWRPLKENEMPEINS